MLKQLSFLSLQLQTLVGCRSPYERRNNVSVSGCENLRGCGVAKVDHLVVPLVNIWQYLMANPRKIVPVSMHMGMFV